MQNKSSFFSLFEKSLKLSLSNIWRNKVLSLATVFVTGTILFIFNIILSINFITQSALTDLNKKVDITVYLKETTTEEQAQLITKDLEGIKEIAGVNYTSKAQALEQIKTTHPDLTLSFEKYNLGNPLPASLNIITVNPKYHQAVADFLAQDKYQVYLSNVITNNSSDNNIITSVSKNLIKLSDFTHQVIFWLIITFVLGGALIILNALQITIFTRKNEISVMKLVGASHWFIRSPFIIESIIYGISSVLLSFIMFFSLTGKIQIEETSFWSYYTSINFILVFLLELLGTILLCIFSSSIAIHEYLKQDLQD
ncbi:MAG: permease-like cell division protein FtsX [Candidatus Peregrinibacteria bacterium]|nr:permease-like cell division protein FtsX [Candidatus Peregrinibacteria bacterium]